ncbi:MAG TPA: ADP-ribosylglycohydrolase family protein [bacterium]
MAGRLQDGARGCIVGGAVADALGGPAEGLTPAQIRERFGGWITGFGGVVESTAGTRIPPLRKGAGRVTDDTLLVAALSRVYIRLRRHLTAHDIAEHLVAEFADRPVFVPDMEMETHLVRRLFYAEQYMVHRLRYAHADPREAGAGNIVNCGAAIFMAPVGIVNAGDPEGAYREAIDITGAHQWSYGREAAGIMAAAVAEALRPGTSVESIVEMCLALARDGTREAIRAAVGAARESSGWEHALPRLREAVRPFDSVGEEYRRPAPDARRPSRTKAIEELPVALGMLVAVGGAWSESVLGSVNYGRDADSIAGMAGAIAGAFHGIAAIPEEWEAKVTAASRLDLRQIADELSRVSTEVFAQDEDRWKRRTTGFPPR